MPAYPKNKPVNRIIDANINRAKEGLRVCEEVSRFIFENRLLTKELKKARHGLESLSRKLISRIMLLEARRSSHDIGKQIYINELERGNCGDIFFANIQRAKESVRVLEEFSKLINQKIAVGFKEIRYSIYGIEKNAAKKITSLRDYR